MYCRGDEHVVHGHWLLHLFTIFVCDNRACSRAGVCAEYNAVFEKAADDSSTGAGRIRYLHAFTFKESIAVGSM